MNKIKCELCDKEELVLIKIEVAGDSIMSYGKGICYECFKKGEIEVRLILKTKKYIQQQIDKAVLSVDFWKDELNKFEKSIEIKK